MNPLANSHTAPVSTDISATFDTNINASTATADNFVVHSMQRGILDSSTTAVSASGATISSNPGTDFFPGELIQATVTPGVQSTGGQGATSFNWMLRAGVSGGTGELSDTGQSLGGNNDTLGVHLGDVDGDGDLDAFSANYNVAHRLFINQGGAQSGTLGTFSDSGQSIGGLDRSDALTMGDLDGDGDLDVIAVARFGFNLIWVNQGGQQGGTPGVFLEGAEIGGNSSFDVTLGDVDGDGDLDVYIGNGDVSPNYLYINQGGTQGGTEGTFVQGAPLGGTNTRGSRFGDLDGDGDLDVFISNVIGGDRVWINQGGAQGGTQGTLSDNGQSLGNYASQSVSLGDLDGDGDLDAFVANLGQPNRVWINQGGAQSGTPASFSSNGQALGNYQSLAATLGDVDGDGDLDAVVANGGQGNRVWLNQGGKQSGTPGQFSDSGQSIGTQNSSAVNLGDVNGDGALDALIGNNSQPNQVYFGMVGNRPPTLDALANVTIDEDDPQQTVNLTGISAGTGETQPLQVTAVSSNTGLIPNPAVTYTTPNATGTLTFTPVAEASGSATVTVTVEDGGADLDLSTTADNATFSQTFDVTVSAVNDLPTLDPLSDLTLNQGAPQQTVNLSGISAGGNEVAQPLRVTAASDNTGLIPTPSVTYTSPDATGTLVFSPMAGSSGTATVTVTVEDGGLDNELGTAGDNATFSQTFVVTVNAPQTSVTNMDVNGGSTNRSGVASLTFHFNEATTIDAAGSLMVWNHTTGSAVDVSGAAFANNGTTAVTLDLSGITLPDGIYTVTLPKTAATLAATFTGSFHKLPGDSTGDAQVGFGDFGDLATNFNAQGGPLYGAGDMNGDGDVGFADFSILANNFNRSLTPADLDFGDAPESGTGFPTTLVNDGARHVLGSNLILGTTVDGELDGQPDATAGGDGADEDGVTFGTLTAGTGASVTVMANVPGTAVLNAWMDFNADGDWDDAGEQVFVDQALSNGTNNLTATIPGGATSGQTFARFRVTSVGGYSYDGLAKDGEVEDYQITIVAAKGSSSRGRVTDSLELWSGALANQLSDARVTPAGLLAEEPGESLAPAAPSVVDLALEQMAQDERPTAVQPDSAPLKQELVDQVFDQDLVGSEDS